MFRKKILVVGGKGFIGSHLNIGKSLDLKYGQDVRDGIEGRYDTIVFLAVDMEKTNEAFEYNSDLYRALNRYMARYPRTHVIFTSSAAVYGESSKPVTEEAVTNPLNLYGESKLNGEFYLRGYRRYTILRLANVYGTGGKGVIDLFRAGCNKIYGDGSQIRDYISVDKVVRVIRQAIKHPKRYQGTFNVSTGIGISTKDIFILYGHGTPIHLKKRKGDVRYSVLDNHKLRNIHG